MKDRYTEFYESWEWRKVRYDALRASDGKCELCGRSRHDGVVLNVDHIVPLKKALKRRADPSNLQVLCHECNHGKGNREGIHGMSYAVTSCHAGREHYMVTRIQEGGYLAYTPSTAAGDPAFTTYLFLSTETLLPAIAEGRRFGAIWPVAGKPISDDDLELLRERESAGDFEVEMEIRHHDLRIMDEVETNSSSYGRIKGKILGFANKRAQLDIPGVGARFWFPVSVLHRVENPV